MTNLQTLAEQHIREHESRLKHIDELIGRARERVGEKPEVSAELEDLAKRREDLAVELDELRLQNVKDWDKEEIAKAGPMGVWDAVAQALEKLVERLER